MDDKMLRSYRAKQAKPVFLHSAPKPRTRFDLVTFALAGLAVAAVAALVVTLLPIIT